MSRTFQPHVSRETRLTIITVAAVSALAAAVLVDLRPEPAGAGLRHDSAVTTGPGPAPAVDHAVIMHEAACSGAIRVVYSGYGEGCATGS